VEPLTTAALEWAVASRGLESGVSGDAHIARLLPGGALFGVVDGLGHGPAAAVAAREAVRHLSAGEVEDPIAVVRGCHERLRETRGVVLTLVWIDGTRDCMTWLGVGNVQGELLRGHADARPRRETLIGRGGIVGRLLPPLDAAILPIAPGDLLVLATDGISRGPFEQVSPSDPVQRLADDLLARGWTGTDDALVLAVRYRGTSP
jgi:serine/threonine protein phosphatase PrpC